MNNRNGTPPQQITPEQVAQVNAMREAQAATLRAQRRESLAGIILNGICAGVYSHEPQEIMPQWGNRAVSDAVALADRLMTELAKPPAGADAANN